MPNSNDSTHQASLRLWELDRQVISRVSLHEVARPYMQLLAETNGETLRLFELHGGSLNVVRRTGRRIVR